MSLQDRIATAITSKTGQTAQFASSQIAYGGCINDSRIITLTDKRQFFIKTHSQPSNISGLFETEYNALLLLAEPDVIHIPKPIAYADDFIIIEVFKEGRAADDWQEQIGRQLAKLHKATQQKQFGFYKDNYLGATKQPNNWQEDWLGFWREQRIAYQLALFAQKVDKDDRLISTGHKLIDRLDDYLADIDESAVLLHGDLWSGNAAANEKGEPVIFDPASYYGHREAEIGMMRLFGGFGSRCEAAYAEVWPLPAGAEERITLYRLYHELNHLNLFGQGYYQTCLSTMRSLI